MPSCAVVVRADNVVLDQRTRALAVDSPARIGRVGCDDVVDDGSLPKPLAVGAGGDSFAGTGSAKDDVVGDDVKEKPKKNGKRKPKKQRKAKT